MSRLFFFVCMYAFHGFSSNWHLEKVAGNTFSSRLIYHCQTPGGYDLEFLHIQDKIYGYINIPSPSQIYLPKEKTQMQLQIEIEAKTNNTQGFIHKGAHRIAFCENAALQMLKALKENKPLKIRFSKYQETISPLGFSKKYKKFMHQKSVFEKIFLPNPL